MKKSWFFALVLTAVICMGSFETAEAAKYRLASMYATDNYVVRALTRMADRIRKQTDSKVDIVIYPSDQLGNYENCYQEVMRGTIDMIGNYP